MNAISSIGEDVYLYCNYNLKSLSGPDNISAGQIHYLNISENDSLSCCEIESICDFFADPSWTVVIHSNAEGCDSYMEIQQEITLIVFYKIFYNFL